MIACLVQQEKSQTSGSCAGRCPRVHIEMSYPNDLWEPQRPLHTLNCPSASAQQSLGRPQALYSQPSSHQSQQANEFNAAAPSSGAPSWYAPESTVSGAPSFSTSHPKPTYPGPYSERSYPVIPVELQVQQEPTFPVHAVRSPFGEASDVAKHSAPTHHLREGFFPLGHMNPESSTDDISTGDVSLEDEPPLLEELGIRPDHIAKRMRSALFFHRIDQDLLVDVDMCGPLFIAACLGGCLLLTGKVHFGYIYGLSVTGCIGVCLLLNLMSQNEGIDVYKTVSILGYGLLPVVGLAAISILVTLRSLLGMVLSAITVLWCTATASRFFETALEMTHQRFLVAYPILLLYGCFVLITVF